MTDYKNKYIKYKIKYLNLVGGVNPQEIDLLSCTKFSYFKKNPEISKQNLELHNFTGCFNVKISNLKLNNICIILLKLISQLHDFEQFIQIFKDEPTLKPLVDEILVMFKNFSFSFKFNLDEFIDSINKLFVEVYKNINRLNFKKFTPYFRLNFEDYNKLDKVEDINIYIYIKVFRECYDTIFKLILELKGIFQLTADYAYRKLLFDNFNTNFKNNMQTLYSSAKDTLKITFTVYESTLRNGIQIILTLYKNTRTITINNHVR